MCTASIIKKGVYFWITSFVVHMIFFPEGRIHFFVLHHIKSCINFRQVVWQQQDKNIGKTCWVPNFIVYFLCLKFGTWHVHVKSMQIDKILVKCTRLMVLYRNKNLHFQVRQPLVIKRKTYIIF